MVENGRSVSCIPSKQTQCMHKVCRGKTTFTVAAAAYVWLLLCTLDKVVKPQQEPPLPQYVNTLINSPVAPPAASDWR